MRPDAALLGMYVGQVIDRDDPEALGRVRLTIPGLIEDSAWALPIAVGGGGAKRGVFHTPPLGADVTVWFAFGDPDQPHYSGGHWGYDEVPSETDGHPDCHAIETANYIVVLDDRPASEGFRIIDKSGGGEISFSGTTRRLLVKTTVGISLETLGQVDITGAVVTINGIPAGLGKL